MAVAAKNRAKWEDPGVTAKGGTRATVAPIKLETLWFNTGTLCNIECVHCYIESSPKNDRLAYITTDEVKAYLDEIERDNLGTSEIGLTGGEPFLNPGIIRIIRACLKRDYRVLILTNAMKPMMNRAAQIIELRESFGDRLKLRVSLDHYIGEIHDKERGEGAFEIAVDGIKWLSENKLPFSIAGRSLTGETDTSAGYEKLFKRIGVDLDMPQDLVVFPEMDAKKDPPEITSDCWDILNVKPESIMCATSRMVVKRKGEDAPTVAACALLPYDPRFELGRTLKDARRPVSLQHPHCASFCVLGGASCSG